MPRRYFYTEGILLDAPELIKKIPNLGIILHIVLIILFLLVLVQLALRLLVQMRLPGERFPDAGHFVDC